MDEDLHIEHSRILSRAAAYPCPYCGHFDCSLPIETLRLNKISEANKLEWSVEGEVKLIYCIHRRCINCGNVFEIVNREIPMLYHSIKCQLCKSSSHMECRIILGEFGDHSFTFTAKMECRDCGEKTFRKLAKVIKGIWRITKIKISLSGIEVEKAP